MPEHRDHRPPSTPIHTLRSFNSLPTGQTIRAVPDSSYHSYHDFRDAILAPPAALTTHATKHSASQPTEADTVYPSNHRRTNTQVSQQSASWTLPTSELAGSIDFTTVDTPSAEQSSLYAGARRKFDGGGKLISNWFQGTSDSIAIGALPSEYPVLMNSTTDSNMADPQLDKPPSATRFQKRMTAPSFRQVASSWFGSRDSTRANFPELADDEILNLDIAGALYPTASGREYSQESFEALQANAENILRRLQATYKQRTFALHEVLAEKTALQEEVAEAGTRVQNAKSQLNGLAQKTLEQEKRIEALTEELEKEKQGNRQTEKVRVAMLPNRNGYPSGEILETPRRHVKRPSSSTVTSDSGFESGDESSAESVFSRRLEYPGSPPSSLTSPTCSISPEVPLTPVVGASSPGTAPKSSSVTPHAQPRLSAYDRVLKGLSPLANSLSAGSSPSKCSNCHGVPASEAWSVMGVLKDENKGLKVRITELESVVDDCLGLVA